jgi:hypothetical protein
MFVESRPEPRCRCGAPLVLPREAPVFVDREALQGEESRLQELARAADRLSFMIVATDCPRVDVDIARAELRRRCATLFPDKLSVFDLVYESRFRRLWEQFRGA